MNKTLKALIINLLLFFLSAVVPAQTTSKGFQWIRHHGDVIDNNPEKLEDIQTDRWGNIYVAGQVNDVYVRDSNGVRIKSRVFTNFDSLANNGGLDVWIAKYNPQGDLLWERYAGSGADDAYYDMVADQDGNCYISGRLTTQNFRKGKGFDNVEMDPLHLGSYIAKLDNNGNVLWHKSFGGDTIGNFLQEYLLNVFQLQLSNNSLYCYISGGGEQAFSYQKLFGRDSLKQSYHELKFDFNGDYLGFKTFPFSSGVHIIRPISVESNNNGTFITGFFNGDTLLVGSDTLVKENVDNALILGFDTSLNYVWNFQSRNTFDQFIDADVEGDSIIDCKWSL